MPPPCSCVRRLLDYKHSHLLLWCPAPLPAVLSLLSRCRPDGNLRAPLACHPIVAAYVARCLRCYDVDTLSFAMPQLVQSLRHDVHGHLLDVLVRPGCVTLSAVGMHGFLL